MNDAIQDAVTRAGGNEPSTIDISSEISSELPFDIDPELLVKQIEGGLLKKKIYEDQIRAMVRENFLENLKTQIASSALASFGGSLPIPIKDEKALKVVSAAKQAKEIMNQKRDLSRGNLLKAAAMYTYPMNSDQVENALPVPNIPTVTL